MHISKAIDEMSGGYSVNVLTAKYDIQEGGDIQKGSNIQEGMLDEDLYIPFGLYYQNDRAEYTFYKPQNAGTVDNALFDYLLDAVSKNTNNSTRKNIGKSEATSGKNGGKKTHKNIL